MKYPKLCIGPVSKNVLDAVIDVANKRQTLIGLVVSPNQVSTSGGYIGHTTETLVKYVKGCTKYVWVQRDHGNPYDNRSLINDVNNYFDCIHIDPFAHFIGDISIKEAAEITALKVTDRASYEIGTEDGIFPYSPKQFHYFLTTVREKLDTKFIYVKSAVIQGNTLVRYGTNVQVNLHRLREMVAICHEFGIMPKIHNADYLSDEMIKFISEIYDPVAWNFAPEFGSLESELVMQYFDEPSLEKWFSLVVEKAPWQKWWLGKSPTRDALLTSCGHYVYNTREFQVLALQNNVNYFSVRQMLKHNINTLLDLTK